MIDILSTMSPDEYTAVRAELTRQGLWGTARTASQERHANQAAERALSQVRQADMDTWTR